MTKQHDIVFGRLSEQLAELWQRRELIQALIARELRDRHKGTAFGAVWAYFQVLALVGLYLTLFTFIFPARFGDQLDVGDYSPAIMAGIIQWLAFQDILNRSPRIIIADKDLVKQIVFPTLALPIKTAVATIIPYSVALAASLLYSAVMGVASWMLMLLPILVTLHLCAMLGFSIILGGLGVVFRDAKEIVALFCTFNLFAQPILFNPYAPPPYLGTFFYFNPFSYSTWVWQDVLFHGSFYHPIAWVVYPILCLGTLFLSWFVFDRARVYFGDLL